MSGVDIAEVWRIPDPSTAPASWDPPPVPEGCDLSVHRTIDERYYWRVHCPNPLPWHLPWRGPLGLLNGWYITAYWLSENGDLFYNYLLPDNPNMIWDDRPIA